MGLDMYLHARREVNGESAAAIKQRLASLEAYDDEYYLSRWSHGSPEERENTDAIVHLAGLAPLLGEDSNSACAKIKPDGKVEISMMVVYWRKANSIHAWFVDNVQGGVDECQNSEVHPEMIAKLASTCEQALSAYQAGDKEAAGRLMTPRSGFFFGNTEVDDWWAEDLMHTVRELRRVIETAAQMGGGMTFEYQSSW